jgi:lysophospholipase L1-like esterase
MAAAINFITAHKGHIGLITVSIGGNDVVPCVRATNPITCVSTALPTIKTNLSSIASQLRSAAGGTVPIIGSTYPDVILGAYVYPTNPAPAATVKLANLSVLLFKYALNPALSQSYSTANGVLVDVTKATGAYTSLKHTVPTQAYGTIPVPVASVCTFAWFCAKGDIHPKNAGYLVIGKLIVAKYHVMKKA